MPRAVRLIAAAAAAACGGAWAAASTDGSTGPVQTLSGRFTVPQTLGTLRGANLFHSFARFSIAPNESATFTTTDAGIRHVVSRVTGGEASLLQGPLALRPAAGSRPDFWFVNPSGITVGAGARFDVPAGLHLATAQQVRFADGSAWSTTGAAGSSLTVAEPQAFGFVGGAAAAAITLDQADVTLSGRLTLAAGDLFLRDCTLLGPDAPMQFVAVANATAVVPVAGPLTGLADAAAAAGLGGALQMERSTLVTIGNAGISASAASVNLSASDWSTSQHGSDIGGSVLLMAGGAMSIVDSTVSTETSGSGNAGAVTVTVQRGLRLARNARVSSTTFASGDAGPVRIDAATIDIDGSGIFSEAFPGSAGRAGDVRVTATGGLVRITDAGSISSSTFSSGRAGDIAVLAKDVEIAGPATGGGITGVYSQAEFGSSGRAGDVRVEASGALSLRRGGSISSSSTFAAGDAGDVRISAASVEIDGSGSDVRTGIGSIARGGSGSAGSVTVDSAGLVRIVDAGSLSSDTFDSGHAGGVVVHARDIEIVGSAAGSLFTGISSDAYPDSSGRAGSVRVQASGSLSVRRGGMVSSSTFGAGDAGNVRVIAGSVEIDGSGTDGGLSTGVVSASYPGSRGNAGSVTIESGGLVRIVGAGEVSASTFTSGHAGSVRVAASGGLAVRSGGSVSSSTVSTGDAGDVRISAASVEIDGSGTDVTVGTGVFSAAERGSRGHAGAVTVESGGLVRIVDTGNIASSTFGAGNAGAVNVQARDIQITGAGSGSRGTGILSQAEPGSSGRAGSVRVEASGGLTIQRGGSVSSSTFAAGDAGDVRISAASVEIDGSGTGITVGTGVASLSGPGRGGNAGTVVVESAGLVRLVDTGSINSGTYGSGRAGSVLVRARDIEIVGLGIETDGRGTGIASQAEKGSSGHAGSVSVQVAQGLSIRRGGIVSSTTFAAGAAGDVRIDARTIDIDGSGRTAGKTGAFSQANSGSSGQTGNVSVRVDGLLSMRNGASLSIANQAEVPGDAGLLVPTALAVDVGRLEVDRSSLSASATANTNASRVEVVSRSGIALRSSAIGTSANQGDGGDLRVRAADTLSLLDSSITTSVFGSRGSGGDIAVQAPALVLRSGFIQANTAAARAQGGDVRIDAPLLVPDGSNVFIGGNRIERVTAGVAGFNVIQAAAPEGLSGTLDVTLPQLSLSGALAGLSTARLGHELIGRDACYAGDDSSFTRRGRGALPRPPGQPLRVAP